MKKGLLIVVSGPSGCGKGTILTEILKDEKYYFSVSATTRTPREGEVNGVNYHFLSRKTFENLIASGGMLEYAEYCNNYYGTPSKEVGSMREKGLDVILEIEVQGAMQVKEICPDAVLIFIAPPSLSELEWRLRKRGTESEELIAKRVAEAVRELEYTSKYNYIIVNGDLDKAVDDFREVVRTEELKIGHSY